MHNAETYSLIDKFLSGNISNSELDAYNQLKNTDPDFSKTVDQVQQANEAIHLLGLSKTSDLLNNIHQSNIKRVRYRKYGIYSLSILIISVTFSLIYTNQQKPDTTKTSNIIITNPELKHPTPQISQSNNDYNTGSTIETSNSNVDKKSSLNSSDTSSFNKDVLTNTTDNDDSIVDSKINTKLDTVAPLLKDNHSISLSDSTTQAKTACPTIKVLPPKIIASCKNQANGQIRFDQKSFTGGTKPYSISITSSDESNNGFDINSMRSGTYHAIITDGNNCSTEITNIIVPEKRCTEKFELRFSPRFGETLSYPELPSDYTFYIFNQSNTKVHQVTVDSFNQESWDGQLDNGEMISSGIYLIELKVDGETVGLGTLTVI